MFVSANYLAINYGVDDTIAKFFADREPPADNLYWKGKLMYLRPEAGWLFIPLITDLLFKSGIPKSDLLSDNFTLLMEQIGHFSAEEELKIISHEEMLTRVADLVKYTHSGSSYFNNLNDFMSGGSNNPFTRIAMPFKALHRGDVFLYSLCGIKFDESLQEKLVRHWFALIGTLLLLDDAEDLEADKASGEENAFLESGLTKDGVNRLKELVKENLTLISSVNQPMAVTLKKKFAGLSTKPLISELINL